MDCRRHFLLFPCIIGAEQEWKLAKNDMEAAANSLFSATRELTMASAKAKSASGMTKNFLTLDSLVLVKLALYLNVRRFLYLWLFLAIAFMVLH